MGITSHKLIVRCDTHFVLGLARWSARQARQPCLSACQWCGLEAVFLDESLQHLESVIEIIQVDALLNL